MKKLIYLIVAIVALSLIIAGCGIPVVPPVEQNEINNLAKNGNVINVPGDQPTIQAAIGAASSGDTIQVAIGTYDEGSLVFNKDDITLSGSGTGTTTIITSSNPYGVSVLSGINNIAIIGLTIKDENQTMCSGDTSRFHLKISHNSGFTLENVNLEGPGKDYSCITGLDLNTVQGVTIRNVEITGYSKNGVSINARQSSSDIYPSDDISFEDVTIDNNGGSIGWAGIAFYTISTESTELVPVMGSISLVQFLGANLISNNPMGIYVENTGNIGGGEVNITGTGTTTLSGNDIPLVATSLGDLSIVDVYAEDVFGVPVRLENVFASPYPLEYSILVSYWHNITSAGEVAIQPEVNGKPTIFNLVDDEWYVVDGMSIQDAIDAASDGDTINVTAGEYEEQIRITKPLTLISDTGNYRTSGTILTGDTTIFLDAHTEPGGVEGLKDVTIQGFRFDNISVDPDEGAIRDGEGDNVININILSNSFYDIPGPAIKSYTATEADGWNINDNKIESITGGGMSGMALFNLKNSVISNNYISDTMKAGILLDGVEYITVSGNIISNVPEQGIQVGYTKGKTNPSSDVTIIDNLVAFANTSENSNKGGICIYPNQSNISITENTLIGNYNGITVRKKDGVVYDTIHVNFNNIYGNDGFGVGNFAQGGGMLDATCNWWGHPGGPLHLNPDDEWAGPKTADRVSPNVDYHPWLHKPMDN